MKLNKEEIATITYKIGEAGHNLWLEKRAKEKGWHNPANCPLKIKSNLPEEMKNQEGKFCNNCHPCMVPFGELPESERVVNNIYTETLLKVLDELNYEIVKKL